MRILLASILIVCSSVIYSQAQLTLDVYPPTCEGCCDGAINLLIDGCLSDSFKLTWAGPVVTSWGQNISDICEPGVYYVAVTDENNQTIEATMDLVVGADPYIIIENFTLDCVNGAGNLSDCFLFPPSGGLSNGEACVTPPECWVEPVSYAWFDDTENVIGTEECITGLTSGNYSVIVTGDEGEQVFFEVSMSDNAPLELISQEVCPSGINDLEHLTFELYPNPTSDQVLLTTNDQRIGASYQILDLQGRKVSEGSIASSSISIDLSSLGAGGYLISVSHQDGRTLGVERLVVKR